MTGRLISYGSYLPHHRLQRSQISRALGADTDRGCRTVAGYDEDTTSMGVEAARRALRGVSESTTVQRLLFATADPAYVDKTNACVMHAALRLDQSALAVDMAGSVRSGVGALVVAAESNVPTLAVLADVRTGLPGGADERDGGDGAAAFVFADSGAAVADVLAHASVTQEFLERWRLPGAAASRVWEERFGEHVYRPLAEAALAEVLKKAGLSVADIDLLVATGLNKRAVRSFVGGSGIRRVADDLSEVVGNTGTAQPGLLLAHALDQAEPGQTIAWVVLADGATAMLLRTAEAVTEGRSPTVAEQVAGGDDSLHYAAFLSWRGLLPREPPRRPDPVGPAAPPTYRSSSYKYGFVGHRCEACATVHVPAVRVCVNCKAVDRMAEIDMADVAGTIVTYTIDHLAYSPSPPVIAAVVDFDGGGRFSCELTDTHPSQVAIGDRVEMTFRRMATAGGIHNYFWKVRPL